MPARMDISVYAEQRYRDGLECARRATQFDQERHFSGALSFYSEAVEALTQACSLAPSFSPIMPTVQQYAIRAEKIREYLSTLKEAPRPITPSTDKDKRYLRQIEYLLELAVQDDERGQRSEAEKMYTCAIELALQAQKQMSSEADKAKLKTTTKEALSRLEQLKLEKDTAEPSAPPLDKILDDLPAPPKSQPNVGGRTASGKTGAVPRAPAYRGPLTSFLDADPDLTVAPKFDAYSSSVPTPAKSPSVPPTRVPSQVAHTVQGKKHKGTKFTEVELKVLRLRWATNLPHSQLMLSSSVDDTFTAKSFQDEVAKHFDMWHPLLFPVDTQAVSLSFRAMSVINGVTYLPWSDHDLLELRVVSSLPQEFKDPNGLPQLGDKQKARFEAWLRPHDICENPKMAHLISSFTIKQSIIGDCSFIASLAVSADYERKFKTRLVTRCIYPQNRHGEPILNPNGKYFVCFNLNGCRRKVVIDDRLPVGHYGELLCSYSTNRDEFWISLIEKAYLKVMGGYDFPGSSSNIDLHALTGWIPERIGMKDCNDETFKKLDQSLKRGDALITVATGQLSDVQAERAGLVPTHAYAVLNVVEIRGLKLMQLKNPWSEKRWKGNFSEHDRTNWTPELRRALNFDQTQALHHDNGVFWIDWKSLHSFYDVVYVNWRPEIFKHKSTVHDVWKPSGVTKDLYDISTNPQYSLRIQCSDNVATVWVLLSRHITTKSDFAHNEKFITLNIAKSDGRKVYFPDKFTVQGVKINTPHYLAKLENLPRGISTYTVIVSQLESLSTIHYTLKVYSTCEFALGPVPNPHSHSKQLKGEWKPGQKAPPRFVLTTVSVSSQVMIKIQAPKELFVRVEMAVESPGVDFPKMDFGPARPGLNILEVSAVPKGTFAVFPKTYSSLPGRPVPFFITLSCDNVFNFDFGQ